MTKPATDATEKWLPIPGYEGLYEISSFSRVRSLDRLVAHPKVKSGFLTLRGDIMKMRRGPTGFLIVRLSKDGRARDVFIERIVAELFPTESDPTSLPGEEWKDIPDYEGFYQASTFGRVRGIGRYVRQRGGHTQLRRGKVLQGALNRTGYWMLILCKDGKQKAREVHRLIALTFIPNPLGLPCVNHKDGTKTNNRPENLEWCTQRENVRHGFSTKYKRAIAPEIMEAILARAKIGESAAKIARELKIPYKTVLRLTDGSEWRHRSE